MSVCRFWHDGSDVYVYYGSGGWTCCGCKMGPTYETEDEAEMAEHLRVHIVAGHVVPSYAFENLGQPVPEGASRVQWTGDDYRQRGHEAMAKLVEMMAACKDRRDE